MDRQELIDRLNGNYPEYTKKSATKQKKVQHEGQLQIACVRWFHPKNEADGATSGKKIAINAASGVVPGVPDLILALPSYKNGKNGALNRGTEVFYGLGIELKYGKTNNQTVHQKRFQGYWQCAGYKYALCRSLEDFIKVVNDYMLSVDLGIVENIKSYHLSNDDTEHNKQVLNKIIKNKK